MIVDVVKNISGPVFECFTIINSINVPKPAPVIDLPFDFLVIPYNSLEPCDIEIPYDTIYDVVKFDEKLYMLKTAMLPGDEYALIQELHHYELLNNSRWIPEPSGLVCRQGRQEGYLIRYYTGGDLRNHFDADI